MEALVWNTKLRMQRGVGIIGNGVGLLNGQTATRNSIASTEGVGVALFTNQDFRTRDRVAKCTWVKSRKFLGSRYEASMIY
jgi:hypothetical protein